jgi:DNA invertase Pin-like site-specific DNA recombinase/DNA-binding protein H-NS
MKVAIKYKRFSSDDQSQHSFERQNLIIDTWAKHQGVSFIDSFEDEGVSGRTFNRPNVQALLRFIKKNSGRVDYLVVSELTRFSRDAGEAIQLIKNIQHLYNIRIVSASRGAVYDCMDSNSFFMMGLEFLYGNVENIKRQQDINGGIYVAKTEKGRWIRGGNAPYGYSKEGERENRRLVIREDQANIVRMIYDEFLKGTPIYIIKQEAIKLGFKRRGSDCIGDILNSPLYMSYQKVKPWKGHPGGLFPIKGLPPIIPPEKWWQVKRIREKPKKNHTSINDDFPLRGVLHCDCGRIVTGANSTNRFGNKYGYYKCTKSGHLNLNSTKAHEQLIQVWQYLSVSSRLIKVIEKESIPTIEEKLKKERELMTLRKKERIKIQLLIESTEEKYIKNTLNYESYTRWMNQYTSRRDELNAAITADTEDSGALLKLLNDNLSKTEDLSFIYSKVNTLGKQQLVKWVFDNTLAYSDGIYRTQFLPDFLKSNLLTLKEKRLLHCKNITDESACVEPTGLKSNTHSIFEFLKLINELKVA